MFIVLVKSKTQEIRVYTVITEQNAVDLVESFEKRGYEAIYYSALDLWSLHT